IVGNRNDITAIKRAEALAREHAQQIQMVFTLSPDGFVLFDGARRVKYVSPAFAGITGLPTLQVLGLDEAEFAQLLAGACLPHAGFPAMATLRAVHAAGDRRRPRIELNGPGKRVLEVCLRESDLQSVSQILYLRDVTRETEVEQLKSEFLSTAAHELRTPMASIYGFAEVLLTQDLCEADQQEFLSIIFRQSELMASILNELLDLARIEARRGKDFVLKDTPAQALLTEVVREFKLPEGRAAPELHLPEGPLHVGADHKKLKQAILNVISNAYKYSPVGSIVRIHMDERQGPDAAQTGTTQATPMVCISVVDQGQGLTPEQLARVGERFYRANNSGKVPGTGLGMSIVKEIIDLHAGKLTLASTFGVGTTVTLWLPGVAA
ncbi:MAG: PAS domain-containing sensor histidine kinase, partial [Betaproteobacteria bacterium]